MRCLFECRCDGFRPAGTPDEDSMVDPFSEPDMGDIWERMATTDTRVLKAKDSEAPKGYSLRSVHAEPARSSFAPDRAQTLEDRQVYTPNHASASASVLTRHALHDQIPVINCTIPDNSSPAAQQAVCDPVASASAGLLDSTFMRQQEHASARNCDAVAGHEHDAENGRRFQEKNVGRLELEPAMQTGRSNVTHLERSGTPREPAVVGVSSLDEHAPQRAATALSTNALSASLGYTDAVLRKLEQQVSPTSPRTCNGDDDTSSMAPTVRPEEGAARDETIARLMAEVEASKAENEELRSLLRLQSSPSFASSVLLVKTGLTPSQPAQRSKCSGLRTDDSLDASRITSQRGGISTLATSRHNSQDLETSVLGISVPSQGPSASPLKSRMHVRSPLQSRG